jgi:hypothetical protein
MMLLCRSEACSEVSETNPFIDACWENNGWHRKNKAVIIRVILMKKQVSKCWVVKNKDFPNRG